MEIEFFNRLSDKQLVAFEQLHDLFSSFPNVEYKIRYNVMFYRYMSWFCYVNPLKNDCLELCFVRGRQMSQYDKALLSKNRKTIAGLTIKDINQNDIDFIASCFIEAMDIDKAMFAKR